MFQVQARRNESDPTTTTYVQTRDAVSDLLDEYQDNHYDFAEARTESGRLIGYVGREHTTLPI